MSQITTTTSTARSTVAGSGAGSARGCTLPQLLAMEWIKRYAPRSTAWTLLLAALLSAGVTAMLATLAGSSDELRTLDVANTTAFGLQTAQLFMIVLGALAITSEYGSGSIRTTLAAVAGRGRLMTAKAIVVAATAAGFGVLAGIASSALAGALLPLGFDTPAAVAETVAAGAAYLALAALLALGTGLTLRSTAGTIALLAGLLAVLPSLVPVLPARIASHVLPYLPTTAGEVFLTGGGEFRAYGRWAALAILCGRAAVALAAGYGTLRTRDA